MDSVKTFLKLLCWVSDFFNQVIIEILRNIENDKSGMCNSCVNHVM